MDKKTLRIRANEIRKKLDMEQISSILTEKLVQTEEYKNSKNIMLFYPLKDEVNLLSLLKDKTKQFYLPRINGDELECCMYKEGDELCQSCFHTQEPTCNACNKSGIDLVIVPALACDRHGFRLGYGGGFYDRFLKDYKGIKVCCIPKDLLLETVYAEKHDIKMDLTITELS